MISLKEQQEYIESKGWSTWYNPKYWVHTKTVYAPNCQEYTYYGMDLNSAYCFEQLDLPKFKPMPFPSMSMKSQGLENIEKIKELLKKLEKSK